MANLFQTPSVENFNTTLTNAIAGGDGTITLNSTTGLRAPGHLVIDRVDASGTVKSTSSWEYISYTGISSNDLTGCSRGLGGVGSAQAHSAGAVVEAVSTAMHAEGVYTTANTALTDDGTGLHVSTATVTGDSQLRGLAVPSAATIRQLQAQQLLTGSGASIQGIGARDTFTWATLGAMATSLNGDWAPSHIVPGLTRARYATFMVATAASGSSVVIDITRNGTTMFPGVTKPAILAGGTFVSTASINSQTFNAGDRLRVLVNSTGTDRIAGDPYVQLGTEP